jgi:riboflavin biosynthesis pyrimidine reductase
MDPAKTGTVSRETSAAARRGEGPARFLRMFPEGPPATAADVVADALRMGPRHEARPTVWLNMISTLDGRATVGGSTSSLGGDADLELLMELRTVADAILLGTQTVRVEGYARFMSSAARRERRERAGQVADPPAVLISRRFDVPWDAGLFASPEQPVIVYTAADGKPPPTPAPVEVVVLDPCTPSAAMADLHRRGIRMLLSEGGPTLFGALVADGVADGLFLTLFPRLTGDVTAPTIMSGVAPGHTADAKLRLAFREGDELFLQYALLR